MLDMNSIEKMKLQFELEVIQLGVLLGEIENQGFIGEFNSYYKNNSPTNLYIQDQVKQLKDIEEEVAKSYKELIEEKQRIDRNIYMEFTSASVLKEQEYKALEEKAAKPLRNKMAEYLFQFEKIRFVLIEGIKTLNSSYNDKLPALEQQRQDYNKMIAALKDIESYPGNYEGDLKKLRDLHEIVTKSHSFTVEQFSNANNNSENITLDLDQFIKAMTVKELTELDGIKDDLVAMRNKLSNDIRALIFDKEKTELNVRTEAYKTESQQLDNKILTKLQLVKNKIQAIDKVGYMFTNVKEASKQQTSHNKPSTDSKDLGGARAADAHEKAAQARTKYLPKTPESVMDNATRQEIFLMAKCKEVIKKEYAIYPLRFDVQQKIKEANNEQDSSEAKAKFYGLINDLNKTGINIDDFRPADFETDSYKKLFTDYIVSVIYTQEAGKQFLNLNALKNYAAIPLELNERLVTANDFSQLDGLLERLQQRGIDCSEIDKTKYFKNANDDLDLTNQNNLLALKRAIINLVQKHQQESYQARPVDLTFSNEIREKLECCEGIDQLAALIDLIQKRDPKGADEIVRKCLQTS